MTADDEVEYGVHLPLIDLGTSWSLPVLKAYVRAAAESGYRHLCANDHLLSACRGSTARPCSRRSSRSRGT